MIHHDYPLSGLVGRFRSLQVLDRSSTPNVTDFRLPSSLLSLHGLVTVFTRIRSRHYSTSREGNGPNEEDESTEESGLGTTSVGVGLNVGGQTTGKGRGTRSEVPYTVN